MNRTKIDWALNPDGTPGYTMTPEYIAGFFDGEGSAMIITIRRKLKRGVVYRFRPVIKINQKTPEVLDEIMNYIDYGHLDWNRGRGYSYIINGLDGVLHFCNLIGKHTMIKRGSLSEIAQLASFQKEKQSKNLPYTLEDTNIMLGFRDMAFFYNKITRTGLKQKYSWLQIVGETNFVTDIKEWKENRMRGLRRLHSESHKNRVGP